MLQIVAGTGCRGWMRTEFLTLIAIPLMREHAPDITHARLRSDGIVPNAVDDAAGHEREIGRQVLLRQAPRIAAAAVPP
jgi:hypothetical protein